MNRDNHLQTDPEYVPLDDDLLLIKDLISDSAWIKNRSQFIGDTLIKTLEVPALYDETASLITEVLVPVLSSGEHQGWFKDIVDAIQLIKYPADNTFQNDFREVVVSFSDLAGVYGEIKKASQTVSQTVPQTAAQNVNLLLQAYIRLVEVFNCNHNVTIANALVEQMSSTAQLAREHGLTKPAAYLHRICANYYIHQGEFDNAEIYAKIAMSEYGVIDDLDGCADAACTLAIIYREWHNGKKSDAFLAKAREQAQKQGYGSRYAILLYEEGVRAYIEDVYRLALSYLDEALMIFEGLNASHHVAMTNTMLAMTYVYMDEFSTGEAKIALARTGWQALKNDYELANLRFVEAVLEVRRGDLDAGVSILDEAQAMANKLPLNESRRYLIERIEDYRLKHKRR